MIKKKTATTKKSDKKVSSTRTAKQKAANAKTPKPKSAKPKKPETKHREEKQRPGQQQEQREQQKDSGRKTKAEKFSDARAAALLNEAIGAGKNRDYKKAILILEELLSSFEAPPEAYLYMGRSLHAVKNYSRALASYNDYVRLKPEMPEGYLFAGRSYITLGMPAKAVPLLRKALSLAPKNIDILALLGTAYLKSRHSRLAVETFQKAVEDAAARQLPEKFQTRLYRAYLNALFIRGINLCRIDEYELGSQMLGFILENGGDTPLLRLELGRACREMGKMPEALEHYSAALNNNPGDLRLRWYRTSILMALGRHTEAIGEIEEIRAIDSGLPDLPWNSQLVDLYMIRSFMEAGEWRRSADCCRLWLKQYGPDPMIHALYAEVQRNLRRYDSAQNHLERAVELEPTNIQLWYELILISWEAENWKALEKALRTIKKFTGEDDLYRRFSILLKARTGEDHLGSISLLQKAIRDLGPEPELMYALGECYLKTGMADLALNWFNKTVSLKNDHEKSWLGKIAALEVLSSDKSYSGAGESGLLSKAERHKAMSVTEQISEDLKKSYDQYVSLWPDNFTIRRERALFLIHTFEYEEAISDLESLLAWEPTNFSLRRVLAYACRKAGRYREAAVYLKSLLKAKPRDTGILIEYSGCLERSGAMKYAINVLEKANEFMKGNVDIFLALGLLYSKDRKLEKAFDLLREAATLDKKDPRPYKWMAYLAARKGDKDGVKRYEREAAKRAK